MKDTKPRTPDAPPPPVVVVPLKDSSTRLVAHIKAVEAYLADQKTNRTWEIADACGIPRGSIGRVLSEALRVRNISKGVWALKKSA